MNESALIELQSSPIQLESSPIQTESFSNSIRALYMCTIRRRTRSVQLFCNWIKDLSESIKEPTRLRYGKMME